MFTTVYRAPLTSGVWRATIPLEGCMDKDKILPEVEIEALKKQVGELSRESAAYRTGRNDALRKAHAYGTIIKAHNIDVTSVSDTALQALPIENGKVDGVFAYSPPEVQVSTKRDPNAVQKDSQGLTMDDVKKMSPQDINANWKEVSGLLSTSA